MSLVKVILMQNYKLLGKVGTICAVKGGYARNYLVPNSIAIYYTKSNFQMFEDQKKAIEEANIARHEAANKFSETLPKSVKISMHCGEDGKLFGSVTRQNIANAINKEIGGGFEKSMIHLIQAIKYTGSYNLALKLHDDVVHDLELVIERVSG